MKKLAKKNYAQNQSLHGYYYACTCLCAVCHCTGPDFLKINSNSSSNGHNVSNATSTAKSSNGYC